jgi:membrane fusion protein (multidrug efflux system)
LFLIGSVSRKDYVANIQSEKNIELRAQKGGILEQIYVDEGQTVKAGSAAFPHCHSRCSEELEKSKAEADQARIELQNTSTLARINIVSSQRAQDGTCQTELGHGRLSTCLSATTDCRS